METTVKERIMSFISTKGISIREFEKRSGLSNGYIKSLKGSPTVSRMSMIIRAFPEINPKWLQFGEGDMFKEGETQIVKSYTKGIPYFNVDFEMGYDEMFNDQTSNPEFLIDFKPYNKCDVWCNARGNSMYPTIASGDIIALKEIKDTRYIISNEIYAIVTDNGMRTIKRIIDKGDRYTLVPDNKEYPEQYIDKSVVTKLFLVVGAMKMF
ncbi:MAG: LexA family transcriptional regulator [Phocaeicola sp.]|nr:LexA family transcriptional regulator [Phocaeicola sp.]